MGMIAQFVSALLRARPGRGGTPESHPYPENCVRAFAHRPISMPEMIMASAFLDFGCMPDERFLHQWRICGPG
jgi:hypothetical protein